MYICPGSKTTPMILDIMWNKNVAKAVVRQESKSPKSKEQLFSLLKGISWRIVGTIDTMMIAYFITGHVRMAISIGSVEVFTKITLFYFHDRAWERLRARKKELADAA